MEQSHSYCLVLRFDFGSDLFWLLVSILVVLVFSQPHCSKMLKICWSVGIDSHFLVHTNVIACTASSSRPALPFPLLRSNQSIVIYSLYAMK